MPITLGCPSCGKRFRARDESAGKRVKCPYCAAPVSVPAPEEAAGTPPPPENPTPGAGRPAKPGTGSAGGLLFTPRPATPPAPTAPVASPDDWGAESPRPYQPPPPAAPPAASPFGGPPTFEEPSKPSAPPLPRPAPTPPTRLSNRSATSGDASKSADQLAAPGWKRTKAGLGWVLFGLFLLALPGFAEFGKAVAKRSGVELPQGPGDDWISISGYINSDGNAVKLSKEELLDGAAFGIPAVLGMLFLAFGRLTAGAAPRSSGAKGMFAFSGLFTFLSLAGLIAAVVCHKMLLKEEYRYSAGPLQISSHVAILGFAVVTFAAEFWFLTALAASGASLKRPKAARAVGAAGFALALVAAATTIGWQLYKDNYRPFPVSNDVRMYEEAVWMICWLLVVGTYWRAVGAVRGAIREFLDTTGTA